MKKIIFYICLVCCIYLTQAQTDFQKTKITLLKDSKLSISGETNINDFKCGFEFDMMPREIEVDYYREDGRIWVQSAKLILDNKGFDCGKTKMNTDFYVLLQTESHPEIVLVLKSIYRIKTDSAHAEVDIIIAGKQGSYDIPVTIQNSNGLKVVAGQLKLNIKDFNLDPPSRLFGLVVVQENVDINFNLHIRE